MSERIAVFEGEDSAGLPGLWVTDGTAAGTHELTGITGVNGGGIFSGLLKANVRYRYPDVTAYDGGAIFCGQDAAGNFGLWFTNGTSAGTTELTGINGASQYFLPQAFTVFNGEVLFEGGDTTGETNLWVTNGIASGTFEITGISGANPKGLFGSGSSAVVPDPNFTVFNGGVLFSGQNAGGSWGLWTTDGTSAGTHELTGIVDASPFSSGLYPTDLTVFNGKVLFRGSEAFASDLWVTDGTAAGTYPLNPIGTSQSGPNPTDLTVFNGEVFFNGYGSDGYTQNLWVTDGTAADTHALTGINGVSGNGLRPTNLTVFNGELLFSGVDSAGFTGLWVTNGTAAGTHELTGISASESGVGSGASAAGLDPTNLTVFNGELLFNGYDTSGKSGLWETDGTAAGTHELTGIIGASTSGITPNDFASLTLPDVASDFTGSGTSDILWFNPSDDDVGEWLMTNGAPTWVPVVGTNFSHASSTMTIEGIGDFTGNGISDVLWENPTNGYVGTWTMNGAQATFNLIGQGSTTMQVAGIGDFSGNGTSDILWQNPTNNYVGIWQMQNNVPTWEAVGYGSTTMNIVGLGNFTGNGKDDILWENPTNNVVGMWAMNGSQATWSLLGQGSTTMKIVGVGDFMGSGTDDILWENPTNGVVGFWGMNNGQATSWNVVATASTSYQVAGIGDYDGNGTSDILWRNATTGDVGIWAMNNGQATWHDLGISSTAFNTVKP